MSIDPAQLDEGALARMVDGVLDAHGTPGPEGSISKLATAGQEHLLRNLHLDLLGARGTGYTSYEMARPEPFTPDSPQRAFLRCRATTIEGCTSEVMRNILGERVLGLPPEPRTDAISHGSTCRGPERPQGPTRSRRSQGAAHAFPNP